HLPSLHHAIPPLVFSAIPPPPRPTLFPYTTLFRSRRHARTGLDRVRDQPLVAEGLGHDLGRGLEGRLGGRLVTDRPVEALDDRRSEEHTSELQSRENLVCRLLLEKKKKQNTNTITA